MTFLIIRVIEMISFVEQFPFCILDLKYQPPLKTQYFWSSVVPILKVNLLKTDQVCGWSHDFSCIVSGIFQQFCCVSQPIFLLRKPFWTGWIKNPQNRDVITAVCAHASAMRFIRSVCGGVAGERVARTHTWWCFVS